MSENIVSVVIAVVLAGATFLLLNLAFPAPKLVSTVKHDTLYQRVLKTGKIRSGYFVYPPWLIRDPHDGKVSGAFVDIMEAAAKNLGLAIEWSEEVGFGSMVEGLQTGRYDIVASGVWQNSTRGKVADFSMPLFYSAVGAYVRKNDNRFLHDLSLIDSPEVRVATIDGEAAEHIARTQFPRAKRVSLPQMSDCSQMLLNVAYQKADVALAEPFLAQEFIKHNPNTLKNITEQRPVAIFGNTVMFKKGEPEFKSMLDTALGELINSGFVDKVIDKYKLGEGVVYRLAYPYRQTAAVSAPLARIASTSKRCGHVLQTATTAKKISY